MPLASSESGNPPNRMRPGPCWMPQTGNGVPGAGGGPPRRAANAAGEQSPVAGFSECSGLETTLEVQDYPEGGNNGLIRKFPGRVSWGPIKLRRGIALNDELWNWHFDFVEGHGRRRDGIITLMDEQQNPVKAWRFKKGLPVKWVGPSMNAGQAQVAIEELEIGHEGLKLMAPGGSPGLFGGF